MERDENRKDWYFEKWYYEPVLVVPRNVRRVTPGGMEYMEEILEPVTFEQMQEIKRQQGKIMTQEEKQPESKIMTQEEKQLLLKDLCARLPYGVKILDIPANVVGNLFLVSITDTVEYEPVDETNDDTGYQTLYNIKPYLRPLSSMTEEERSELRIIWHEDYVGDSSLSPENLGIAAIYPCHPKTTDFYLSHHFDYRGLIPMGLALEAPEGMYKTH